MSTRTRLFVCLNLISTFSFAHSGHVFTPAVEACEALPLSQQCSFITGGNKRYTGTCQKLNEVKMCVRNQPIEHLDDAQDEEKSVYQLSVIDKNNWQATPW